METLPLILSSVLPLLGVLLGAVMHSHFSRTGNAEKHLQELRVTAYTDYLKCVADNAASRARRGDPELLARTADSKTRIAMFGSSSVVAALSRFETAGPTIDSAEKEQLFLDIAGQMRADSAFKSDQVDSTDLKMILFGPGPPLQRSAG